MRDCMAENGAAMAAGTQMQLLLLQLTTDN